MTILETGNGVAGDTCNKFANYLETRTKALTGAAVLYACDETGLGGGAAILWRERRLEVSTTFPRIQPVRLKKRLPGECVESNVYAGSMRFKDKLATGRVVNAIAVHYPTESPEPEDCAFRNNERVSNAVRGLGPSSMNIMGGDWNHHDADPTPAFPGWQCHYRSLSVDVGGTCSTVGNLGWKDVIYRGCGGKDQAVPTQPVWDCTRAHVTKNGKRIDFIFTDAYAIEHAHNAWYPDAGGVYSDHIALGAVLRYQ